MSLRDRDLLSIQEARDAVERAAEAQKKFAAFSQEQVDAVVEACAAAAAEASEALARLAVEETGYGNVADKIIKNRLASVDVPRAIRGMRTVGILREDREKAVIEIAEPVGVVAAVIPSTNPTSTAIYKTLIALKARNSVVLSPHPSAMRCICESAAVLARAALKMGAPENLIECLKHPTMQGTQELMRHRSTGVILATGGTGLVRAAYSSGRPAYGVGPGNVPALIERTADVKKAIADIFAGKTFDYGTICSSEQAIVAEDAISDQALEECRQQGAYFLTPDQIKKLGEMVFRGGSSTPNPQIVGRAATVIAEMAGIKVPASTRVLIARLEAVGREVPLSSEKLSPILAFYSAPNLAACIALCVQLLQHGGMGHTASIHSQNEAAVKQIGLALPAFRIVVNTSSVHGSIGYSTNLFPAMTLGCGSPGGNITSDNIGPQHLMNIKRVAWESRPVEHRTIPADQRPAGAPNTDSAPVAPPLAKSAAASAAPTTHAAAAPSPSAMAAAAVAGPDTHAAPTSASAAAAPIPDRQTIARVVERVFTARGIPRGGAKSQPAQSTAEAAAAAVAAFMAPRTATVTPPLATPVQPPAPSQSAPAASTAVPPAKPQPTSVGAPAASSAPPHIPDFVSESDVRRALLRSERIYLSPKSIVTPSARDLGDSHDVFIRTDLPPTPAQKSSSASG